MDNLADKNLESVVIDASNTHILQQLWDNGDFGKIFYSTTHWTRITVKKGSYFDRDIVLRTILYSACPVEVIPAMYQIDGEDSFFLIRHCGNFIRKLALTSLKVSHPTGKYNFDLTITTCYLPTSVEPLDINGQIKEALIKRFNREAKTIDLTNFSEDDCLKDIFFPLNISTCMSQILDHIRRLINNLNFFTLVLQHNQLSSLESLISIGFVSVLDLRHNNLTWEGFGKLPVRRGMKLNVVWLDGNPLCLNLSASEYIKRVDAVIPYIRKVDGVDVSNVFFGHSSIKNFLSDGSWAGFIDHFLHHYFGLMESSSRHELARMYHQKATFTFCAYQNPDDTPNWRKLSSYTQFSRNILTLSDVNKAYSSVKVGPDEIIDTLNKLPVIQFDPYSFTIDMPYSQMDEMVLINVCGVFQELNSGIFYFDRTFILTPFKKNSGEWKIANDMLSITTATHEQIEKSFAVARRPLSPSTKLTLNPSYKDKEALIPTLCDLTKLTKEWAARFLEEGSWDLERTLQAFIDQFKANQIPMRAFSL